MSGAYGIGGGGGHARAAAVAAFALGLCVEACTVPLTTVSLSGLALNGGAIYAINAINENSYDGEGYYKVTLRAPPAEAERLLRRAVDRAARDHAFPDWIRRDSPLESGSGPPPPAAPTPPLKQETPAPYLELLETRSRVEGDTVYRVVVHRRSKQVAFVAYPGPQAGTSRIFLYPFDAESGVFLSLPTDHAQRNAVEELHEAFWREATGTLGPDAFSPPDRRTPPAGEAPVATASPAGAAP